MIESRKLRVFLCHASQDKPVVRELYQQLLAEGWIDPWLDEEKLLPGQDWNLEIEKAIKDTDVIIVCLSKDSITKDGYVQKEIKTALDYSDYKPDNEIFIIPVRLDECTPPHRLSKWHYTDYFEGQRTQKPKRLLASLKQRAKTQGVLINQIPDAAKPTVLKHIQVAGMHEKDRKITEEKKPTIEMPKSEFSEHTTLESVARMQPMLDHLKKQEDVRDQQKQLFEGFLKKVSAYLKPFEVICRRDLMGIEQTKDEQKSPLQTTIPNLIEQVLPVPDKAKRFIRRECPRIEVVFQPQGLPSYLLYEKIVFLYYGIIDMLLLEDGDLLFQAAHILETRFLQTPQKAKSEYKIVWKTSQSTPIMSHLMDARINDSLESWRCQFQKAVEEFVSLIENAKFEPE